MPLGLQVTGPRATTVNMIRTIPFLAISGTFSRKLSEIHKKDNRTSILFTVACNVSTLYCDHSGCTGSELLNVVC